MERINFQTASPKAIKAWSALEQYIATSSIDKPLAELVRLRSSQINGCAFCVDMHATDAAKGGETARRLHAVSVWRETPFFTPRERAALGWTETMTRLAQQPETGESYAALAEQFSAEEMVDLTLLISTINGWNRLAVGFARMPE
ncbi:carboxymuconolactone decarboxylase family protein [Massilia antarctica]|uniref:carboxymuconolactone decarboxylase family protein n=1 Tax=Massilia antarctica TaxID=2765360 RepID=UPI0006BB8C41|nr:carboxymuconolactone decarboxylase family protein [Massilia sp. H27-R4]MCY0910353.1 carboxymuconolactone decarboxylase family protein [Massilia sp. H27-R4]CUI09306.1 4-carboxymuconolactone decarboxylase domain/alkylhydroperoxidase AhpD family core domain protein [Janthinobacterium sp. CG23_2]CUU33092.1 4-carboxymuconolactone decarboxylase domain/alkylhydroperoxidase AhpD family core domain protein [Janthinobacterium sp. CG23_2]